MAAPQEQKNHTRSSVALGAIALAALAWYLFRLGAGDVLSDEALIGFRSLRYLDFLFSQYQTTPLEWFAANPPWWTRVWFHDHPPAVFLLQHISFLLFGANAFALRLPSAFAAAASVFLAGGIARMKWGNAAGIIAALGLAALTGHVSMARQGLQEAMLLVFLLAGIYSALRARENGRVTWWYAAVVWWGLAFLTKLTAVGLIPALLFLIWRARGQIALRHRWGIALAALCFIAPLILYNMFLLRATGHFDFQFSYLLGQYVPQWQVRPGRGYFPDFTARLTSFFPNVAGNASLPMQAAAALAIAAAGWQVARKRGDELHSALLIIIASFSILFLLTGPLPWFTYLLWPWLILLFARACVFWQHPGVRYWVWGVAGAVLAMEFFVAWNTVYRMRPVGREGITYLSLWRAHAQWGYQELEHTLQKRLQGHYPGGTFPVRYSFLEEMKAGAIRRAKAEGRKPATLLLVFDTAIHQNALLWSFFRRAVYEGWPVLDVDTYRQMREEQGEDVFWRQGFTGIIFVRVDPDSGILTRTDESRTDGGQFLEDELRKSGLPPSRSIISPKTGKEAFRIYELGSD